MLALLSGILCFLNIVDVAFKVKDKFSGKEEKEGVSYFLNKIGDLLTFVAIDLENNIYPHDKCSEMWSYLKGFESVLTNKISGQQLTHLQDQIAEAYRVEKLLGELNQLSQSERQQNINLLKSCAGSFYAASTLLKL